MSSISEILNSSSHWSVIQFGMSFCVSSHMYAHTTNYGLNVYGACKCTANNGAGLLLMKMAPS
jgi:hypothetical protein